MPDKVSLPGEVVEKLADWYHEYGAVKVLQFDEEVLIFRPPTRRHNLDLVRGYQHNAVEAEHRYIDSLLLWAPEGFSFDDLYDADFGVILNELWQSTIFGNAEKFLDSLERRRVEREADADSIIEGFICAAFSKTPDYVDQLTEKELIDHLVLAEMILGKELPIAKRGQLPARTDVSAAQQQWFYNKMQKKLRKQNRAWGSVAEDMSDTGVEDPDSDEACVDGRIDTSRENAYLMRMLPHLRHRYGGSVS